MDELNSALSFLKTGGSIIAVNWVLSWLLEDAQFWHKLASKTRQLISLGLSALVGVSAYQLSINPDALGAFAPYAKVLLAVGGSWYSMQLLHQKNPNRKE